MSPSNMDRVSMVPGFILKLWKMINDPRCDDLVSWSENGQSFIITDPPRFSQELSKYFKHNNLSSFVRQLNMYGFRKVATIENSGLHSGTDDLHFYHPHFIRNHPERLEGIKRKLPQKLAESIDLRNVYKGISDIEEKQNNTTKTLAELKRENDMLWAELHDLREKHQQQQLYISRLMKLVFEAMEQNGIRTNMLKPNTPLMIEGSTGPSQMDGGNYQIDTTPSLDVGGPSGTTPTPIDIGPTTGTTQTELSGGHDSTSIQTDLGGGGGGPTTATSPLDVAVTSDSLNTPAPSHLTSPNVEAQIENAEYQIDTLVPDIGEFTVDDMDFFAD